MLCASDSLGAARALLRCWALELAVSPAGGCRRPHSLVVRRGTALTRLCPPRGPFCSRVLSKAMTSLFRRGIGALAASRSWRENWRRAPLHLQEDSHTVCWLKQDKKPLSLSLSVSLSDFGCPRVGGGLEICVRATAALPWLHSGTCPSESLPGGPGASMAQRRLMSAGRQSCTQRTASSQVPHWQCGSRHESLSSLRLSRRKKKGLDSKERRRSSRFCPVARK